MPPIAELVVVEPFHRVLLLHLVFADEQTTSIYSYSILHSHHPLIEMFHATQDCFLMLLGLFI